MTESKSNNGLKVIAALLGVALVGTLIYTSSLYSDKKKTTADLTNQKNMVVEDLNNLRADYDRAIAESDSTNQELLDARERINQYLDSVKSMKADIAALYRYRRQVNVLTKEREFLLAQNDSLRRSNEALTMERDSTRVTLERQAEFADSVLTQNVQLAKVVDAGSALSLSAFSVEAVKERNSGKLVSVNRHRRADKLKVCYTVAANRIASSGDTQFYVQVTGPDGAIMGENAVASYTPPVAKSISDAKSAVKSEITSSDTTGIVEEVVEEVAPEQESSSTVNVTYSKISTFYYENAALDVCDYVDKEGEGFAKGNYEVKVFDSKLRELGSSSFTLK
ncbi:hypothetical protein [Sinomicrobium weinanense]|uniref:Chromosome partitioning protein ParA n=1 Tax=Sinomicrobium weinanense TaxID=2842200 RepID=A0A926Q2M3_9FLAO|nr:hypothetical protein [Sinomicrobium weinanense]MBC9795999.1 hypothetical protein [Sinomicrobium weinanense]MBU3122118.1 hypothetical protein [Sinomicrobium weinanense]